VKRKDDMLEEYDFSKGKRGPVIPPKAKTRITIFIDAISWNGSGTKLKGKGEDTKQRSTRLYAITSNRINDPFRML